MVDQSIMLYFISHNVNNEDSMALSNLLLLLQISKLTLVEMLAQRVASENVIEIVTIYRPSSTCI